MDKQVLLFYLMKHYWFRWKIPKRFTEMGFFNYRENKLFAEQLAVDEVVAQFGSPCYLYSRAAFEQHWRSFNQAFAKYPHLVCYAVKANSNIAVLNLLANLGSGFDIVSLGEMERVLAAGGKADKIVFSGVGKRNDEIMAALKANIQCFNIEVSDELDRINQLAGNLGVKASVSFRVNPDVDAKTHAYISTGLKENKFGITIQQALAEYQRANAMANIKVLGIACHIGSQLTEISPFIEALDKVLDLVNRLKQQGIELEHLDLGGGLGVRYQHECPPKPAEYVAAILDRIGHSNYKILLAPGRAIAANAGILVTRVEYLKLTEYKNFAIVDAAMNDLLRPSLYNAWQDVIPVNKVNTVPENVWDVVGPVCETGDFLAKDRTLRLKAGDLLAIRSSGAYGFSMSSNYNSRPRPAELMIDGNQAHLIKARERIDHLWLGEKCLALK